MKKFEHFPVLIKEVIENLQLQPGDIVIDATTGLGGHSEKMIEQIVPGGRLIAVDQDTEALALAQKRLEKYTANINFVHANFNQLQNQVKSLGIDGVDKVLFDLGVSSMQLQDAKRGFSFNLKGPLDMRMNPDNQSVTAADMVNQLTVGELSDVFTTLGEETPKRANLVAKAIVAERQLNRLCRTEELADLISRVIPRTGKIHPATRFFMALRIAVNSELQVLQEGLTQALEALRIGGRMAVISFHSLEDRVVKELFKQWEGEERVMLVNRHVIAPAYAEIRQNPPSRSAKLRVLEKIG